MISSRHLTKLASPLFPHKIFHCTSTFLWKYIIIFMLFPKTFKCKYNSVDIPHYSEIFVCLSWCIFGLFGSSKEFFLSLDTCCLRSLIGLSYFSISYLCILNICNFLFLFLDNNFKMMKIFLLS